MKDIFDYMHVDTKEDIYTFCLDSFMGNDEFRRVAAKHWGFDDSEDYKTYRGSISLKEPTKNGRKKISDEHKKKCIENRTNCCELLRKYCNDEISIPNQKSNSLHVLKCSITIGEDETVETLIENKIKPMLDKFLEIEKEICKNINQGDKYLEFIR